MRMILFAIVVWLSIDMFMTLAHSDALPPEHEDYLSQLEQEMDEGKQPYVWHKGKRWAITNLAMDYFSLESGEVVTEGMLLDILEYELLGFERRKGAI